MVCGEHGGHLHTTMHQCGNQRNELARAARKVVRSVAAHWGIAGLGASFHFIRDKELKASSDIYRLAFNNSDIILTNWYKRERERERPKRTKWTHCLNFVA